jgi:hypothetical protein
MGSEQEDGDMDLINAVRQLGESLPEAGGYADGGARVPLTGGEIKAILRALAPRRLKRVDLSPYGVVAKCKACNCPPHIADDPDFARVECCCGASGMGIDRHEDEEEPLTIERARELAVFMWNRIHGTEPEAR